MYSYAFRCALWYEAASWHGGWGWAHEICEHVFKATPPKVKSQVALEMFYDHQIWQEELLIKA